MDGLYLKEDYARTIFKRLKKRAIEKNLDFDLDVGDIMNLTIPISCPILGIPLKQNNGKQQDNSVSIDRVDNSKGYVKSNIMVMSWRANKLKGDASMDELKSLCKFINNDDAINMTID